MMQETTVTVAGTRCRVEPLDPAAFGGPDRGAPIAEVHAPDGFEFSGGETSLIVHSLRDLFDIERDETLDPSVND